MGARRPAQEPIISAAEMNWPSRAQADAVRWLGLMFWFNRKRLCAHPGRRRRIAGTGLDEAVELVLVEHRSP